MLGIRVPLQTPVLSFGRRNNYIFKGKLRGKSSRYFLQNTRGTLKCSVLELIIQRVELTNYSTNLIVEFIKLFI